jgi:predicted dehydrogenase
MKFGVIGTGEITAKFIKNASLNPDFEPVALMSRTREKGGAFAAQCGIPKVYTSLEELARDDSIEAVYVASPNACHMEHSIRMSEAGKHVFCEKTVASNSRELIAMLDAARKNGKVFLEAMRIAFNPNLPVLKAKIAEMGKPRNALLSVCKYSSRYDAFKAGRNPNAFNPELSNGAVMDMGSYSTFMLVALFGKPDRILCTDIKLTNGFDGFGAYLAMYPGMAAQVLYSKVCQSRAGSEIMFDDGSILIRNLPGISDIEIVYNNRVTERIPNPDVPEYAAETAEFIRCCADPERARLYNELSLAVMSVLDEVRRQNGVVFPADRLHKGY